MSWHINRRNSLPYCTVRTSQTKVVQSKGWLSDGCTKYPWVLKYHIPLHVDDAVDSLDDHLKIEGESRPYEIISIWHAQIISL